MVLKKKEHGNRKKNVQKLNRKFPEIKNKMLPWNKGRPQSIDQKGLQCKMENKNQ